MSAKLTSRLPKIIAGSQAVVAAAVQKAGQDIEASAKLRVPTDTFALRDSIQWQPHGSLEGEVVVGEWYGVFPEFGTRHQGARPYLTPAAEEARPEFVAAVARAYR